MEQYSLKRRIYFQLLVVCFLLSSISGLIIYRNAQNSELFMHITHNNLPKIQKLGALLAGFRDIRIQVRSVGLAGNTDADYERYKKETVRAITEFLEAKDSFSKLPLNAEEKEMWSKVDSSWKDFYDFGKSLLALLEKGDPESLAKLNDLVRNVCQGKADVVVKSLQDIIQYQEAQSASQVKLAVSNEASTKVIALTTLGLGLLVALIIGSIFSRRVSSKLEASIKVLREGSQEIETFSHQVSKVSSSLNDSSLNQASSLQQTVTAIDQISAMVARNADNAESSASTSEVSLQAVRKGKEKVEEMVNSINVISSSNNDMVKQMEQTTTEISAIVSVIQEISSKTQVINDIVFQTKLLSFNASVEAARAGENGKGFAVVAEEVGNLASMSGQAAGEISLLLKRSTDKVSEVVSKTKMLMDSVIRESKQKVDAGIMTASECSHSLDEISANVTKMAEMVKEISIASHEQSTGVREVNKAMNEFDKASQVNSTIAREASDTAQVLKAQAESLNEMVSALTQIVEGAKEKDNLLKFPETRNNQDKWVKKIAN